MSTVEDDRADIYTADELPAGTELMMGQYQITRYLNSGGFGITYLAKDSLDRQVVIKECFPRSFCRRKNKEVQARSPDNNGELRSIVRLFTHEARALSKLKHPFIVGVHQVFEDNNTAYMALDFVEGHDLLAVVEQKVLLLRPDQTTAILQKTLEAIKSVHANGLLHRDIAPDNIIVTNELNPVLIDFGAAREQATKATRALSALRVVKDGYSPQEFYIAGSDQGPYSDLYSLAASFYHLITGELPPDSQVRIAAHVAGTPDPYIPLDLRTSDYGPSFCSAIDKAMAVLPKDRMQSADEWLAHMAQPSRRSNRSALSRSRSRQISKARSMSRRAPSRSAPMKRKSSGSRLGLLIGGGAIAAGAALAFPYVQSTFLDRPATVATAQDTGTAAPVKAAAVPEAVAEVTRSAPAPTLPAASIAEIAALDTAAPAPAVAQPVPLAVAPKAEVRAEEAPLALDAGLTLKDFAASYAEGKVTADWRVDLPFTLDDAGVITGIADGTPGWLTPGARVVAVEGVPVGSGDALTSAVRESATKGNGVAATVMLTAQEPGGTSVSGEVKADIVYSTAVADRFRLETRPQGNAWQTLVADAPGTDASATDAALLRSGDIVVAVIDGDTSIADGAGIGHAIGREFEAGTTRLQFAVNRDGLMWIVSLDLGA